MSIFASQFGYSPTYGLDRLRNEAPSVGARLPSGPKKTPTEDPATAKVPAKASAASAAAAATAAGELGAGNSNSGTVGVSRQSAYDKLMHMTSRDTAGTSANGSTPMHSYLSMPVLSGADATTPSPEWGIKQPANNPEIYINQKPATQHTLAAESPIPHDNPVKSLWHWGAHTFDSARHGLGVAGTDMLNTFQQQNSFGEPQFQPGYKPGAAASKSGPFAQHGASAYIDKTGTQSTYPGVSSSGSDLGIGQDGGATGYVNGSSQAQVAANEAGSGAANSAANDASGFNWAQFFGGAARDIGEEGG